jgi:hypothetical protein
MKQYNIFGTIDHVEYIKETDEFKIKKETDELLDSSRIKKNRIMYDLKKKVCPKCKYKYDKLEGNFHKNKYVNRGFSYVCISCITLKNRNVADEKIRKRIKKKYRLENQLKKKNKLSDYKCDKQLDAAHSIAHKSIIIENYEWKDLKQLMKLNNII